MKESDKSQDYNVEVHFKRNEFFTVVNRNGLMINF